MKTFWAFVLCVLGFYARGDQLTIPGTNRVDAIILNGADLATQLTNKVLKSGDTMTGSLTIQQGSANGLTITNSASQVGLAVNGFAGQAADIADFAAGGTNFVRITSVGQLFLPVLAGSGGSAFSRGIFFGATDGSQAAIQSSGQKLFLGSGGSMAMCISGGSFQVANYGTLGFSSTADPSGGGDCYFTRENSAVMQLGSDAASPVSQTFKACDGSGTDKSGASLTFQGGQATGTGGGGDVIVQTSIYTNSSGSTLRAYTTRSYDRAKPTALTDATTNLLFTVSLPAGCHVGGLLDATIFATDGTDFKSHNSAGVSFSAVNKGGTITASISESAQLETHSESVGTQMTDTWTVQQSGSTVAILVTPGVGSLMTPSTFNCKWGIVKMNSNGPATVTPN